MRPCLGLARHGEGQFDDVARALTFSDPGRPSVIADVDYLGSFSTVTSTFQWAWATLADPSAARASTLVRTFGEVRGHAQLATANRPCSGADVWEMAAVAWSVLGGDAVYRLPVEHVYRFVLMTKQRAA